jgi:hypothetical protein
MSGRREVTYVTREMIHKLRESLTRVAETRNPNAALPQKVSRPRAIRALRKEITAVFRRGYEVEDLLASFKEQGLEIDAASFREYWRQTRKKKNGSESRE